MGKKFISPRERERIYNPCGSETVTYCRHYGGAIPANDFRSARECPRTCSYAIKRDKECKDKGK